jgi:F0F1-type ATP synthase delta subunit
MKKQLEELVKASYQDGKLDEVTVKKIADKLNRHMLKLYISLIKREEKKKIVFVTTPKPLSGKDRQKLTALFPKKKIVEEIDPSMIGGIKIVENDEAFDMDLNRTFRDIIRFVSND